MLTKLLRLVISVLFVKGISSMQNDPNSLSNIINNAIGSQSQGIIQKSLNQIASNRGLPINLQQALNARQPSNSQQNQNLQQTLNFQAPVPSQPGNTQNVNVQSSNFEQTSNGRQDRKGYRQPLIVQRPASSPTTFYSQNDNNNQLRSNADQQNRNIGNVQQFQQQAPGTTSYFVQQQPTSQTYQGIASDPFSTQAVVTIPMSNFNSISDTGAVTCSQSQQPVAISGVPSYIIDRSQLSNSEHQPATTSTVNNQFYGVPQGQQLLDISQNDYPNQMYQPNNFQPQFIPSVNQQHFDNDYNIFPSVASQALSPNSLTSLLSSSIASSLSQPSSRSSGLKSLLPLILNILNDRNNNNCCPNCGCNQNRNVRTEENVREGYPKQKRHGNKQEESLKYDNNKEGSIVSEDHNESERPKDDKKQPKPKKQKKYVKYEDSYEEYDNDDYYYKDFRK